MTLHWEDNLVVIFLSPENEMQLKYWYWLIPYHLKCMTRSWILLTFDTQYFQGCAPFTFLQFLIILRWHGKKMVLTSLTVYLTSHPSECLLNITSLTSKVILHFAPLATGLNFGSSDSIGSLKGQSEMTLNRMLSDPNNTVNSLDLILMRLLQLILSLLDMNHCFLNIILDFFMESHSTTWKFFWA